MKKEPSEIKTLGYLFFGIFCIIIACLVTGSIIRDIEKAHDMKFKIKQISTPDACTTDRYLIEFDFVSSDNALQMDYMLDDDAELESFIMALRECNRPMTIAELKAISNAELQDAFECGIFTVKQSSDTLWTFTGKYEVKWYDFNGRLCDVEVQG